MSREEQLERENELLRLGVAYFKKLKASNNLSRKAQTALSYELKQEGFKLKNILKIVNIPEATYHYHIQQLMKDNPDDTLKEKIITLFYEHDENYGYRRIHSGLIEQGVKVNHKKVLRLMKELDLKCTKFTRKSRRYNSYKSTVGKVAKNLLNRRFNTSVPLQNLVTDITEFKCSGNEKLYLNPILDLYNREIISYGISNKPTLDLVLRPLNEAVTIINDKATYRTTIHSDQGWHYQHNKWVKTLKQNIFFKACLAEQLAKIMR